MLVRLDTVEALEGAEQLVGRLREKLDRVNNTVRTAQERWKQLGRVGGQREDHAAGLLNPVRMELEGLIRFATAVERQLKDIEDHPFGE